MPISRYGSAPDQRIDTPLRASPPTRSTSVSVFEIFVCWPPGELTRAAGNSHEEVGIPCPACVDRLAVHAWGIRRRVVPSSVVQINTSVDATEQVAKAATALLLGEFRLDLVRRFLLLSAPQ